MATEDEFSVQSAKLIGVHDGDLIVVDGKARGAYGHTCMINHCTNNVTRKANELEVMGVQK